MRYHDCAGSLALVALLFHAEAVKAFNPVSRSATGQCLPTVTRRRMSTSTCSTSVSVVPDGTISRRTLFRPALTSIVALIVPIGICDQVSAEEGATSTVSTTESRQPFSPSLKNLVPSCRVRVYIDDLLQLTKSTQDSSSVQQGRWKDLEERLLLRPPTFLTEDEAMSSEKYMQVKTWSSWEKAQAQQKRADPFNTVPIDPAKELNQAFEQWSEERQWKILRSRQQALERSNPMRAAFNAYTNNLVFGESYVFTGSAEERKRRIRNNALPDVTAVIRSDLDLRDLYRNQVLTAMDDAKAELQYQLTIIEESRNPTDLMEILEQAKKSCDEWFRFVPEADVKEATAIAMTGL